jgi:two-component system cell cycle response regulator DivK
LAEGSVVFLEEDRVSRKRILVVEDNEDNRHILVYRLRKIGDFDIIEASHGQEALDLIVQNPPDLMFLDLKLPVLDGWETARRIRAMEGAIKDLPIIALTAQAMVGDEEKALAAGCDDYIAKPIVYSNIVKEKVERLLSQGRLRIFH